MQAESRVFLAAATWPPQPAFGQAKTPTPSPPNGFQPTPQFINGKEVLYVVCPLHSFTLLPAIFVA